MKRAVAELLVLVMLGSVAGPAMGEDGCPDTGTVDVDYRINYVALAGIEFHTIAPSDSYTAHLEFSRG